MRAILFAFIIIFSAGNISAQSVFDSADCGGISLLSGYDAGRIYNKSREWVKVNLLPLNFIENETAGTIVITCLEDYDAKASDKLPRRFSGKFLYTFIVTVKEGYYSYNFVNIKYIPRREFKNMNFDPQQSSGSNIRMRRKTWEKITRSAFRQLQEKGKLFDRFMQSC